MQISSHILRATLFMDIFIKHEENTLKFILNFYSSSFHIHITYTGILGKTRRIDAVVHHNNINHYNNCYEIV